MNKKELRQYIRKQKKLLTEEQLREQSQPIIQKLLAHPRILSAKVVLMYHSLPDEVGTHEAIEKLIDAGKVVLLPVVVDDTTMELHQYTGSQNMHNGFFDIKEPSGNIFTDFTNIDVAVIPGMSFDEKGNRLGRGKGYYDRFLGKISKTYKIGLCFPFQHFPKIPIDKNDIRMDEVLY